MRPHDVAAELGNGVGEVRRNLAPERDEVCAALRGEAGGAAHRGHRRRRRRDRGFGTCADGDDADDDREGTKTHAQLLLDRGCGGKADAKAATWRGRTAGAATEGQRRPHSRYW